MKKSSKKSAANLYETVLRQQGFFTAKQAKAAGYTDAVHGYHIQNGDWERVQRGIYRLVLFPPSPWPELVVWSLWSRDRNERPQGVFSHETASRIHGRQGQNNGRLHMTVPTHFRKGTDLPDDLVLHFDDLDESEVVQKEGYLVTSPERTRADMKKAARPRAARAPSGASPSRSTSTTKPQTRGKAGKDDWAVW